jgi:hypothetical protein
VPLALDVGAVHLITSEIKVTFGTGKPSRPRSAELDEHLDGEGFEGKGNHRNGYSKKSVLTGTSKMTLSVPRDRAGTFDPKLANALLVFFRVAMSDIGTKAGERRLSGEVASRQER